MSPMQQMFLGLGSVTEKTYIDDIFGTTLYVGNESSKTVTTGIDLSTDGGLVIGKSRGGSHAPFFYDTVRGVQKYIRSDVNAGEVTLSTGLTAFSTTGFSLGSHVGMNDDVDNAVWSFKKKSGFFDIATYTGTGSNQNISHSLGSVPGMILVKCTSDSANWRVYHSSIGATKTMYFNDTNGAMGSSTTWNNTTPTTTHFSVGANDETNKNGESYVAYLFAGESFQDDAVQFDGVDEGLTLAATSDFHFGTDDFTIECFTRRDSDPKAYSRVWAFGPFWNNADSHGCCFDDGDHANKITWANYRQFNQGTVPSNARVLISTTSVVSDRWYHVAVTRKSGVFRLFIDGKLEDTNSSITTRDVEDSATNTLAIGRTVDRTTQEAYAGQVSNFRVVNGQALYTADFNPPSSPLTQTSQGATSSNVKLLCCNQGTTTGSTVTPGTISDAGSPAMTKARVGFAIDSDACIFGESGTEPVISCGNYVGNGSSAGPEIKLGWEPQWVLIKRTDTTENWFLWDSLRGIVTGGNDARLIFNSAGTENDSTDRVDLTSTGFKPKTVSGEVNASGGTYIYMCLRRPDGYVGKPVELATSVFALDTGNGSTTIPAYDSGFPVDFALDRRPASTESWYTSARLMGANWLKTNDNSAVTSGASYHWDSNVGYVAGSWANSDYQSWMWKRHAGLDVVMYTGNGTAGHQIAHSMNKAPEMIWIKRKDTSGNTGDWMVGHKGLNGGSSPWNEYLVLNKNQNEYSDNHPFNNVAPTTTTFQLSTWDRVNANNSIYIAMLFASVDGISKIGSYSGSSSNVTLDFGFLPRFFMTKGRSGANTTFWTVWDSTRGITGGGSATPRIFFNDSQAQTTTNDNVSTTSTGITIETGPYYQNQSGYEYVYYAHA